MEARAPREARTVLIASDDAALRASMVEVLEERGYTVVEARDGTALLTLLQLRRPNLVVSEVHLPGLDGAGLLRRLKERGEATPVVVMADDESLGDTAAAMRLGAVNLLLKPFADASLVGAVAGALLSVDAGDDGEGDEKPLPDTTKIVLDDIRAQLARGSLNLPVTPWIVRLQ